MGRESIPAKTPPTAPLGQNGGGRRRDAYSPFRAFIRKIEARGKGDSDLTVEDLKALWDNQQGICPITGWSLDLVPCNGDQRDRIPTRASLDRIDSSLGYVRGNVRWVALIANLAKCDWTDAEVLAFAQAVVTADRAIPRL